MITMEDISLVSNVDGRTDGILIAFVLDGSVVHIMGTYLSFFELLTAGHEVLEDTEAPEGVYRVKFVKDGEVVEALECSNLLSAILRSEPTIVEILREPKPSLEELGLKRFISIGWLYNETDGFTPPPGWVDPRSVQVELTEAQKKFIAENMTRE